jgi:hypothetical protein
MADKRSASRAFGPTTSRRPTADDTDDSPGRPGCKRADKVLDKLWQALARDLQLR